MSTIECRVLSVEEKPSKVNQFNRLSQSLFSCIFEFIEAESIVNFQRGSNKQIFAQCSLSLKRYLEKMTVLKYCDMHLIRAIRPHPIFWGDTKGNFLVSREQINNFGHLLKATPNVVFLDFSNLPEKTNLMKIASHLKDLQKLSGISFAESRLKSKYLFEILKSEGLQNLTSLDVSSTDTSDLDHDDPVLAQYIAFKFPKLECLNLNSTATHPKKLLGLSRQRNLLGIRVIVQNCKNLKSLKIRGYDIGNVFAQHLSKLTGLTELDIMIGVKTAREYLEKIFTSCKNITSLTLSCFCFEEEALEVIGNKCENLKILRIIVLSDTITLKKLVRCPNLQKIYVKTSSKIDKSTIEFLKSNCSTLRKLYIEHDSSSNGIGDRKILVYIDRQ